MKKCMVIIFVLKKINCSGNYYLFLTGRHICHYLMARIMVFATEKKNMIDKQDTFSFFQSILSSFYPGQILSTVPLKIVSWVGAVQADIFWNHASEKSQVSIICKKTVEKLMYKSNVCSQLSSVITYVVFSLRLPDIATAALPSLEHCQRGLSALILLTDYIFEAHLQHLFLFIKKRHHFKVT